MEAKIGIHLIVGSNPEPFLEAALRSVEWVDYFCVVNTDPDNARAVENEQIVRKTVPRSKLRLDRVPVGHGAAFDFARARNACLDLADDGDYVFILDADDVHYPEWEFLVKAHMAQGHDMIIAHFWHLIGYKDLWGKEPHREIVFTKTPDTKFNKAVHEGIEHPRTRPCLAGEYHYVHYGYIKPPREIYKRWVLYSQIEGDPDHYEHMRPDDALAGWLEGTQPFWRNHPPAVRETLESYPSAPKSVRTLEAPRNIGLVMLTWNDAENLKACLKSLATTRQPFHLVVVDNASTDDTYDLLHNFRQEWEKSGGTMMILVEPHLSLAQALNKGFNQFMTGHVDDPDVDYIGWIHPDMIFERDTWLECLRYALDTHPDIVKVGAHEMATAPIEHPIAGNSQCYLVRKSALQEVGLFDERFEACGGYEDWDINNRLLKIGRVVIWPDAHIRHNAMGTRKNHDNVAAAKKNATLYHSIWDTWNALV